MALRAKCKQRHWQEDSPAASRSLFKLSVHVFLADKGWQAIDVHVADSLLFSCDATRIVVSPSALTAFQHRRAAGTALFIAILLHGRVAPSLAKELDAASGICSLEVTATGGVIR